MKAAVLRQPGSPLRIEDLQLDAPGRGELRVRIAAAGVCHSDYHYMCGDLVTPLPVVLGHEGAGIVEEVGEGVTAVRPGDHVLLLWRAGCGHCDFCARGRPALCASGRAMLASGGLLDGSSRLRGSDGEIKHFVGVSCFAERAVVAEPSLLPIPKDIPLEIAALTGCAVMTGVGAVVNTARVEPGSSVLVIGAGGIGLCAVMGAHLAGASVIVVADLVESKLELARDLGATHVVHAGRQDVVEVVRAMGNEGVDYAFEAIGNEHTLAQAVRALRPGGTAVAIGLPRADASVAVRVVDLVTQEKTLKGSIYGSTRPYADMPRLFDLYRRGRLPLDRLLTRRYRLDEINEAYRALLAGEVARSILVP